MRNRKNEKKVYNAAMVLVFLGMVLMLVTLVQMLRIAPIMGIGYVMGTLGALGFGYMFTLMGFIILREMENKDDFDNRRY